jgi:hypothetical protein
MSAGAQGRVDIEREAEVHGASIGDTLVMDKGGRTGQIVNLYQTLGTRPYVMVVSWVDTGNVGLVFPGPGVYTRPVGNLTCPAP